MGSSLLFRESCRERHRILRHVERTKQEVDAREHRGKIFILSPPGIGMVPSVKDRAHQEVAKWPERPTKIRVNKKIVEADQHRADRKDCRAKSQKRAAEENENFSGCLNHAFNRMESDSREPIYFLRAVVDGMKCPNRPSMKDPVAQINDKVPDKKKKQQLTNQGKQ